MGSLFKLLDTNSNKFYFNETTNNKLIIYEIKFFVVLEINYL